MSGSTNITFLTPSTYEELAQYKDLVRFYLKFTPLTLNEKQVDKFIETWAGHLTLVFVGSIPYGAFYLDVFKNTVERHGIARPDAFWFFLPQNPELPFKKRRTIAKQIANGVLSSIIHQIFHAVFYSIKREKIIVKVPKGSKDVLGFVRHYHFEPIPNTDKGRRVYKLTKARYEALYGAKESVI